MALIKCTECGHEVSDKASACPHCGCPIEKGNCCIECGQPIPDGVNECPNCGCPTQDNLTHGFESPKKNKSGLIWLVPILALSVLLGGGYYFFKKANGTEREEVNEIRIDSHLADGHYTFKGNWESSRYSAQPCKLEFEKNGMNLESCAYTNLKYDTRIPLTGTIKNDTLHFVGDISGKQLVITLKIASDGDMLIGEGIDYAHRGDRAILKLTKISSGEEKVENEDSLQEGDSDWLQGRWVGEDANSGYPIEVIISGDNLIQKINGQECYNGPYEFNGNMLTYNNANDFWPVDGENKVLTFDGKPMRKEDGGSSSYSSNASSQPTTSLNAESSKQEKELKIMARLHELGKKGQSLVSELSAMRQRGQMDPLRYLYIKQVLILYKDEQIRLSQELGDEQMTREYMQQKDGVLQSFRMIENGY